MDDENGKSRGLFALAPDGPRLAMLDEQGLPAIAIIGFKGYGG